MTGPDPAQEVLARRWPVAAGLLAVLLLGVGWAGLATSRSGLSHEVVDVDGIPVTMLRPEAGEPVPGMIVAHGFASSSAVMDTIATGWARAGYAVAVLDFPGHGRNPEPLLIEAEESDDGQLRATIDAVTDWLIRQPYVAPGQVSLVGHSMGAGAVVAAGVADRGRDQPRYAATVAISLPDAEEIPDGDPLAPANLLLLWGSAEPVRFADAALAGLRAGYPGADPGQRYGEFGDGTARAAMEVPGAEHLGIVFRTGTAQQVQDWLAGTGGAGSRPVPLPNRLLPAAAFLAGAVLAVVPLSGVLLGNRRPAPSVGLSAGRAIGIMAAGALAALVAAWIARPLLEFVPLAVGGYLLVWFSAGAVVVALLGVRSGAAVDLRQPPSGAGRAVAAACALSLWTSLALVIPGRLLLSPFTLAGPRLWLLLVFAGVFLVWFAADEVLVRRSSRGRRAVLMAVSRTTAVAALLGGVLVLDAPGLLLLVLPLLPPLFLLLGLAAWIAAGRTSGVLVPAAVQAWPLALLVAATLPLTRVA